MEATASFAGNQGWGDTISKLMQPSKLRPFLILLALFFFYPISGVYNISFFAVSLFKDLGLGGAETVAVFTALVRCLGTVASTLLLLRSVISYPATINNYSNVCDQIWSEDNIPCHQQPVHTHHWDSWNSGLDER